MTITTVRLPDGGLAVEKRVSRFAPEGAAARLVWERECLLALAGVPGIVRCLDLDRTRPALLLEFAAAGSLAVWLADPATPGVGRLLPPRDVVALGAALATALAGVHEAGFVHRDVKPSNVLLRDADVARADAVCLADFGVAARTGFRGSFGGDWTEEAVGTLGYAAPEQLADPATAVHPAADVYSLGVVLYELATGRLPHELAPDEDEGTLHARDHCRRSTRTADRIPPGTRRGDRRRAAPGTRLQRSGPPNRGCARPGVVPRVGEQDQQHFDRIYRMSAPRDRPAQTAVILFSL